MRTKVEKFNMKDAWQFCVTLMLLLNSSIDANKKSFFFLLHVLAWALVVITLAPNIK